jgi:hypothetical protein
MAVAGNVAGIADWQNALMPNGGLEADAAMFWCYRPGNAAVHTPTRRLARA